MARITGDDSRACLCRELVYATLFESARPETIARLDAARCHASPEVRELAAMCAARLQRLGAMSAVVDPSLERDA